MQRNVFSGHKRCIYLNYMTLNTPGGLISTLSGPVEKRENDLIILRHSG